MSDVEGEGKIVGRVIRGDIKGLMSRDRGWYKKKWKE